MVDQLTRLPTERGARFYKTQCGLKVPSVTTILSVMAKPALIPWAAAQEREAMRAATRRAYDDMAHVMAEVPPTNDFMALVDDEVTKEKAYRTALRKAGNIGTQVHKRIEWEFLGETKKDRSEDPPALDTPEAERSFAHAITWRKETKLKVIDTERMVVSLHGQYAGTLDALVKINGKVGVVDWKTGKRVYSEHFLQNCAYRLALAEEGIKTQAGWIVLFPKNVDDVSFSVVEVPPIATLVAPWMSAVTLYRWQQEQQRARTKV